MECRAFYNGEIKYRLRRCMEISGAARQSDGNAGSSGGFSCIASSTSSAGGRRLKLREHNVAFGRALYFFRRLDACVATVDRVLRCVQLECLLGRLAIRLSRWKKIARGVQVTR